MKRTNARVSLKNIIDNYKYITSLLELDCKFMAVVKADAYGHGLDKVANSLQSAGVKYFAVASIDEALELRKVGISREILILGHVYKSDAYIVSDYNFIATVTSAAQGAILAKASYNEVRAHIKIDTGMSRNGIYCHNEEDLEAAYEECAKLLNTPNLFIEGIYTHFANAEDDEEFTRKQYYMYKKLTDMLIDNGYRIGIKHCCNTAGTLYYPEYHLDMVRCGLGLYGYAPDEQRPDENLKKCMILESRVTQIHKVKKGDTISYGRTFAADKDMEVAIVSIGYGDGYSRLLSNKDSLYLNGKYAKVLGRVCMDACVIDVTDIPCKEGDLVTVFGTKRKGADKVASLMGTISYEVLCDVGKRVPREYDI